MFQRWFRDNNMDERTVGHISASSSRASLKVQLENGYPRTCDYYTVNTAYARNSLWKVCVMLISKHIYDDVTRHNHFPTLPHRLQDVIVKKPPA
ncbi:hypothetical protein CAEBREN_29655 [Caenorhabditis brenneri]|uniref:Uncharacterized protein n=1 Tax=Caenorhabditis brenneri TaxID=135651 RepID=G0PJR8_CAEBE|nr:hypothetical protein CAEBREN_29655 [Caenorhabditis brenneri]